MPIYTCECCQFSTHIKTHYTNHLKTKKHMKYKKSHPKVTKKSPFSHPKVTIFDDENPTPFQCHYCSKSFKYKQGMYRHIKYSCKHNKDEDLKELARLLNEKDTQLERTQKQVDTMQRQIDKLTNKLQIKNVIHGNVTNNQQNNIYNIQLLNHKDTDYSHLTNSDYITCIKDCNHCVKTLIEKVHFNETKPENMNIYISNIKGNYAMVYCDDQWKITNKKDQINDLFNFNEVMLENWYDEYKETYPQIIQSFKRYLKNRDGGSAVINRVKEKILLMLYNNRNMIHDVE